MDYITLHMYVLQNKIYQMLQTFIITYKHLGNSDHPWRDQKQKHDALPSQGTQML